MMGDLRDKGVATNIYEYNEYCKKQNKSGWSYVYILSDEFSVFTPDNTDSKEEKAMKSECLDMVKRLSKTGREMGIFVLNGVQKTTKEEIPSIIKSQSAVRVSFRANDAISSQVIMGDNSAVGLADRYAVYSLNGGEKKDYLFSPLLTTEMINRMLEPHIDRKHKKVDLSINDDVVQCDIKNTKMYPTNFSPEKINKTTIETFNSADYEEVI
jgi:DNA segregation ATPase FtsK/SpoIIIE-like protein